MVESREPLFLPFRALGYITDKVPFAVQRLGRETYVTVSVGKAWQVGARAPEVTGLLPAFAVLPPLHVISYTLADSHLCMPVNKKQYQI